MDPYHSFLDTWLLNLPGFARHCACLRLQRTNDVQVTEADIEQAVNENWKCFRRDALTFGVGMIADYNRALLDAAEVLNYRLQHEAST